MSSWVTSGLQINGDLIYFGHQFRDGFFRVNVFGYVTGTAYFKCGPGRIRNRMAENNCKLYFSHT